jgi:dTDP-4-amino-4,6-dideoxygalactose transaminase
MQNIPQTNPKAGYLAAREGICNAIERVLASGIYILGQEVEAFECEFAGFVGTGHAVAVASGTDALELALRAAGIKKGDLVATVAHTAVATVAAIQLAGGRALLLDEDNCYGMDPQQLEQVLASHTELRPKAVVPVHLYGQMVDPTIFAIADKYGIPVIEDCAQAHGACHEGQQAGGRGLLAAFSFYPTKNLGALGDAGAVVTNEPQLAEQLREWRQYGWRKEPISFSAGINSRMDAIQAAILRVKLDRLAQDNQARQSIAAVYDHGLEPSTVERPQRRSGAQPVYHQYVIRAAKRDRLRQKLSSLGIGTGIHYPIPVHLQPGYAGSVRIAEGGLRRTEDVAGRIISLPIYPQLTDDQAARVVAAVSEAAAELV